MEGRHGELSLSEIEDILETFPASWRAVAESELSKSYFRDLQRFVETERRKHSVFPAAENVYRACQLTPLQDVRVVILGQDPYHDDGQAHGLSFSVRPGVKLPPSLRNIFRELQADLGTAPASHGCLEAWARQGVLLLNTVLTVRAHQAHSHRGRGWEEFTSRIIQAINQQPHVAFVLWGKPAQEIAGTLYDRHLVIESPHPSPLSAYRGFFGSRPFSRINSFLKQTGQSEIQWELPAESSVSAPLDNSCSATSTPM
jgi:uracil-DNA glycosylase